LGRRSGKEEQKPRPGMDLTNEMDFKELREILKVHSERDERRRESQNLWRRKAKEGGEKALEKRAIMHGKVKPSFLLICL
jgi:hypothetical protein